ncbi:MAG: SurA N-terminal domain-containing protein [Caulobacteraceae bacterium]|nr:SurA N-terminal domain-containing protein [Caulobacteraceae bacterium]
MRISTHAAVMAVAMVALVGCKIPGVGNVGKPKAPTGQVVATVGNREITVRELRAEMAGAPPTADPKAAKQLEQVTLRNIVARSLLAEAAQSQGVDKDPDYAIAKQRLNDTLLVQTMQSQIAKQVPKPTAEDAQTFVGDHPDIFAQRKIFDIDQIRMQRPSDPNLIKALQPLKTLEQIEALLKSEKIPYQRSMGKVDAVGADPRMIDAMIKLPPGEVFVVPNGNILLVNEIKGSTIQPFQGPAAIDYAQKLMVKQRSQEAVGRKFNAILTKGMPTVQFNKDYAPPRPAPAAAKAPAPAAAQ